MRIKLKTRYAGPNGTCNLGDVLVVEEAEGRVLIRGDFAEEVVEQEASKTEAKSQIIELVEQTESIKTDMRYKRKK